MMHLCTVATLCFLEKTFPRNYYYSDQDDNSLSLCFKSMYLTLFVAIFTSNFIFSMSKSFHTYRNINIRNQLFEPIENHLRPAVLHEFCHVVIILFKIHQKGVRPREHLAGRRCQVLHDLLDGVSWLNQEYGVAHLVKLEDTGLCGKDGEGLVVILHVHVV